MRKKNYKGKCEKRVLKKCKGVCRTYDPIQYAFADVLEKDDDIVEIRCNEPMEGTEYMTDFVCRRKNGELMVRECVYQKLLLRPLTMKLLDESRNYWLRFGAEWGIVVDE